MFSFIHKRQVQGKSGMFGIIFADGVQLATDES